MENIENKKNEIIRHDNEIYYHVKEFNKILDAAETINIYKSPFGVMDYHYALYNERFYIKHIIISIIKNKNINLSNLFKIIKDDNINGLHKNPNGLYLKPADGEVFESTDINFFIKDDIFVIIFDQANYIFLKFKEDEGIQLEDCFNLPAICFLSLKDNSISNELTAPSLYFNDNYFFNFDMDSFYAYQNDGKFVIKALDDYCVLDNFITNMDFFKYEVITFYFTGKIKFDEKFKCYKFKEDIEVFLKDDRENLFIQAGIYKTEVDDTNNYNDLIKDDFSTIQYMYDKEFKLKRITKIMTYTINDVFETFQPMNYDSEENPKKVSYIQEYINDNEEIYSYDYHFLKGNTKVMNNEDDNEFIPYLISYDKNMKKTVEKYCIENVGCFDGNDPEFYPYLYKNMSNVSSKINSNSKFYEKIKEINEKL